MPEANFQVRDRRKRKWFWTENLIVDKLMAKIGVHAHGVYSALIRWADNDDQTCAPSLSVIMAKTGLTRPTVVKALKRLQQGRLVAIQRRQVEDGSKIRNLYFILDASQSPLLGDSQLNYLTPSKNESVTLGNDVNLLEKTTRKKTLSAACFGKIWTEIKTKIRTVGRCSKPTFSDPLVLKAIRRCGGWGVFCDASVREQPELRGRFVEAYLGIADDKNAEVRRAA